MESLPSSLLLPKTPGTNIYPSSHLPLQFAIKPWNKRFGILNTGENLNPFSWVSIPKRVGIPGSLRIMAVSKKVSGESDTNSESDDGHASLAQVIQNLTIFASFKTFG